MQIINQLNETNQILQSNINDCSNTTISPKEPPVVIVVPSSDEIDHYQSKFDKI